MSCYSFEVLSIVKIEMAMICAAERMRLLQYGVEHRREVAGRGIDDSEHLGGGGLLLQGFARLGQKPRIFHRDDGLSREVLQQRDLLVGKRADLLSVKMNCSQHLA